MEGQPVQHAQRPSSEEETPLTEPQAGMDAGQVDLGT